MDCIRGMFPFINAPLISNTSISDIFSGCLTCQPFGKMKPRPVEGRTKPSREVKTISSLVDKFASAYDPSKTGQNTSGIANSGHQRTTNSFYNKPCSRQTSFNQDINHEKFTPCEKNNRFYENDFHGNSDKSVSNGEDYGKINFSYSENRDSIYDKKIHEKSIVVPPRRKKRPAPKRIEQIEKDPSMESNLEHEIRKNYQNLKLNNLDQPHVFKSKNDRNNNKPSNNFNNNNNNNNTGCNRVSCLTNNKINNKSGCSNLEVVSDSLVSNAMHFSKFDSVSDTANLVDGRYCENKIYYKNSSFDRFGNYKHGNDTDEIIVCESVIKFEPPAIATTERLPEDNSNPKNSTYTKFYTDSLYQDHLDDVISSCSLDEPFEHIVQLQPDMNPFLQNAFAMLKAKTQSTEKHQLRKEQQSGHGCENPTNPDAIRVPNDSIPVVFCGLLPIHQFNSSKWMPSFHALEASDKWHPNHNVNNNVNTYAAPSCSSSDENLNLFDKDIQVIVNSENKNSTVDPAGEICSECDEAKYDRRIAIDCQYASMGTDRCEL